MKSNWENYKRDSLVEEFYESQSKALQEEGFKTKLEFGTAGIRGKFGLGEGRLNKYTVGKVALGLANYLNEYEKWPSVVIHYDTRHLSSTFAKLISEILANHNIKVYKNESYRTTPELSFAVRYLKASAGIMITASHNPKDYNGIKIYGSDGAQLSTYESQKLSGFIDVLGHPLKLNWETNGGRNKELVNLIKEDVRESYIKSVTKVTKEIPTSDLKVVFTSLHGTSVPIVPEILDSLNFKNYSLVEEQCIPDPNFSSVKSANPEDHEAFEQAILKGKETGANLLISTDPDADRLGIAEIDKDGNVHYYNGNEIGALLLNYRIKQTHNLKNRVMMQSIVTSELGKNIALYNNIKVKEVLTGFKYIAEQINKLEPSENFIFGYEESYGYLAESFVRDKDALQIVPLIIKYASELKKNDRMLKNELEGIYENFGQHNDKLFSYTFEGMEGKEKINKIMQKFRKSPPNVIASLKVLAIEDFEKQQKLEIKNQKVTRNTLPKANVIKIYFEEGFIALRPSGTEPKIKLYVSLNLERFEEVSLKIKEYIFKL